MRVSVVQMNPGADEAANVAQATRLTDGAVEADRPDPVGLPEMWTCPGGDRSTKRAVEVPAAQGSNTPGGPAYGFLRRVPRCRESASHGGGEAVATFEVDGARMGCAACRLAYGRSPICNLWGQVVSTVSDGVGWATARTGLALRGRVRRDTPVPEHRRDDVFGPKALRLA